MLEKINKSASIYLYIVRLIAVVTFLAAIIIVAYLMESPWLYVPAFIIWGILSYFSVMVLRGKPQFMLFLAIAYTILSALLGCLFLASVGFSSAGEHGLSANVLWLMLFMEVILLFALTLLVAYGKVIQKKGGAIVGLAWVFIAGIAGIGALVSLPVQALSFTLVSISLPFTLSAFVCMLIGLIRRKKTLATTATLLFLLAGAVAGIALSQDHEQGQYLYVIASSIALMLVAFFSSAVLVPRRTNS